jgi:hypothetical protein
MSPWRKKHRGNAEAGGIGEAVFVLLILAAVVGTCYWLYTKYLSSTDSEARDYAAQFVEKITVDHDAKYLARNLSEKGKMNFGYIRQQETIQGLTKLGAPRRPFQVEGKVAYGSGAGAKEPIGRFHAPLHYPEADGEFNLQIARRHARWEVDTFFIKWKKLPPAPTPIPTVTPTPAPIPLPEAP